MERRVERCAVRRQVREQPEVIARRQQLQKCVGRFAAERVDRRLAEREPGAGHAAVRVESRQTMLLLIDVEEGARRVLRLLHVRLVEWIDPEQQAGSGGRHFPAQKLGADGGGVGDGQRHQRQPRGTCGGKLARVRPLAGQRDRHRDAIGSEPSVRRFTRDRHDPLAMFARALRNELLDPEAE